MRLIRPQLSRTPFVPADPLRRAEHSREIFNIQSTALAKRLKHTGVRFVTIGVSGGSGFDVGVAGDGQGL